MANEEIRLPIAVPVQTNAGEAASSVDLLAKSVQGSRDALADAAKAMRNLRGSSDEIKAAKDQLRTTIEREKQAISDSTLALLKQGTTAERVAAQAKDAAKAEVEAEKAKMKAAADSAKAEKEGQDLAKEAWKQHDDAVKASGKTLDFFADIAVAAWVAVQAAIVAGVAAFGRWVLAAAGARQSQELWREAVTTSAADAGRLGNQVDLLATKVPTGTEELNKLAVALRKSGVQGQTLVDTLNASAQATAALGDAGGAKIDEIIQRGRVTGRTFVSRQELRGTGIDYDAFAKNLADGTKKSTDAVKTALMQGQVSTGAAAAALRKTVEDKFGGINLEKMLSVDGIKDTFAKLASQLTKGIDLKPLGKGLGEIIGMFSTSSVTGDALHKSIVNIANGGIAAFVKAVPIIKGAIEGIIDATLELEIAFYKTRNTIQRLVPKDAFRDIDAFQIALDVMHGAVIAAAVGLGLVATAAGVAAVALAPFWVPVVLGAGALLGLYEAAVTAWDYLSGIKWGDIGTNLVDGLVGGIERGAAAVESAVEGLAGKAKDAFKDALGIHSPSTVFAGFGQNSAEGYAQGLDRGSPEAESAALGMAGDVASAGSASSGGAAGAGRGGGPVTLSVSLQIDARGAGPEQVKALKEPSTYAAFLGNLEALALTMGVGANA